LTITLVICENATVAMVRRGSQVSPVIAAWLALGLGLALAPTARADDVPADRQALILARALAYDNNLRSRAGDALVVAVVFRRGNAASEAVATPIMQGFRALEGVKVQDLPFHVAQVPYASPATLKSAIDAQGIDVLYICPGLETEIAAIKDLSHHAHVLTIGAREDYVRNGLSLGVFVVDGKNTITVNLAATRDEGAAFAADLLRIGRVIR
jgi:hypothetical protein